MKFCRVCRFAFLIVLCSFFIPACYTLQQIHHHGNLLSERKQIRVLLWDPKTPAQLKEKLQRVQSIREFAKTEGFNVGGAYGTFIDLNDEAISYGVQATPPFEMRFKTWDFPIVGEVPYLGFFSKVERDRFADELKKQGLDVALTTVEAFSSLGWFDDPVFPSMLKRSETSLAHLIFHELTHRTLWIENQVEFNENLAEAMAVQTTIRYLEKHQRPNEIKKYQEWLSDRKIYAHWLREFREALTALYMHPQNHNTKAKAAVMELFLVENLPKFRDGKPAKFVNNEWNNASILAAALYEPQFEIFFNAVRCTNAQNAGYFLEFVRLAQKTPEFRQKPFRWLETSCDKS